MGVIAMRTSYVITLVLFAFVAGAASSHYLLQSEIDGAKEQTELVVGKMRGFLEDRDQYRAMSSLEASVDVIGAVVALDVGGAPRKRLGEQYRDMLKSRIAIMESMKPQLKEAAVIQKSEHILQRANELLHTIELGYL